jgi:hypothetical protein
MRAVLVSSAILVSSLVAFIACGGSNKPAAEPTETPAPEASASASSDTAAPSDSASAAASASAAPAAEAPPPEPSHPVPNVTGMIDGKPFTPKMARIEKPAAKDGRVVVIIDERTECGGGDAAPGSGILTLTTPWEDAFKQDLGSLKRGGKKGGGEISFARAGAAGKKDFSGTFKPTGRVTVTKAATEQGSVGKVNLDLTSGDYMLSGDLDVQVCVEVKKADAAAKGGGAAAPKTPAKAGGKKKKKE